MKYTVWYVYKDGSTHKFQSDTLTQDKNAVEWRLTCNHTHTSVESPGFKSKWNTQ